MGVPRPAILTRITVPSGGWSFQSDVSDAAQYDTPVDATVAAGDYFISGDNQADDLLQELQDVVQTALTAAMGGNAFVVVDIHPTTHKVRIQWQGNDFADATGDNDVRINWQDGASGLASALGFDSSAADGSTGTDYPIFTADYQVSHSWYADEDGLIAHYGVSDISKVMALQSQSLSGKVKTQKHAEHHSNSLALQFLTRAKTSSYSTVGYGTPPIQGRERNEPLHCWWNEAQQGIEFRVYESALIDTTKANMSFAYSADTATTITRGTGTWDVEPFEHRASQIYVENYEVEGSGANSISQRFYIASHTSTVLTVPVAHPSGADVAGTNDTTVYIFDNRYATYVVDLGKMSEFAPQEIPKIDRYNITIPLLRFV